MARITGGNVIEGGLSLGDLYGDERQVSGSATIQSVINSASSGDVILIAPGEYNEEVTIPATLSKLTIIGQGNRGAVFIAPASGNKTALTNHADDVTLINVGCDGEGTGGGLVNTGRRFRAYGCKFEGGANAIIATLGTDAQITAGTRGKGDDSLYEDCEIAWATNGVVLTSSDYGAVTQAFFKRCYFHGLSASSFEEAGATAAVHFRGLLVEECVFGASDEETHALPTKWLSLNDDNANSGQVTRCSFPAAIDSGKNLVSTAVLWIGNLHTAGVAGAQPS